MLSGIFIFSWCHTTDIKRIITNVYREAESNWSKVDVNFVFLSCHQ